ncbi:aminoglycoside phosphotransferase family protein [Alcaligenes sp. 13f]|uniref:aminoglycoside phosphotransferase family protein n=1 Tax=Alcaligenes sp. 13f TaxID=2841924 RepID=UPI00299EA91A|nr:aminoglycoside phosphotransferase family protein [Alcaligenes sp. 13f]
MSNFNLFNVFLQRWGAQAAGKPFSTATSDLMPVRLTGKLEGQPAMIKITRDLDERIGGQVLQWWAGDGAAHVYALDRPRLWSVADGACNGLQGSIAHGFRRGR